MPVRIASIMSLIAFTVCLVIGGFQAENTFGTVVSRALAAMFGTMIVGLIVGMMAQKMLDENVGKLEEKVEKSSQDQASDGR